MSLKYEPSSEPLDAVIVRVVFFIRFRAKNEQLKWFYGLLPEGVVPSAPAEGRSRV